jgi:hypothetical protein
MNATSPAAVLRVVAYLSAWFSLITPSQSLAGATFRATGVVPSVYRQAFSRAQGTWGEAELLRPGMRLNPEDRLISKGSGMANIICENGSYLFRKRDLTQVVSFCQAQRSSPVQAILGSQNETIPYLIEPRATLVRGPQVTVRWNPVAGVQRYQLWLMRLRDRRVLWETQVIKATNTTLPAQLGLVAGETYRLVVEAENGSSSQLEPSSAKLSFSLLSQAENGQLSKDLEEIRSLRSSKDPSPSLVLLEAGALEQRGLLAEAISLLERQERLSQSLEGQLQLGRLNGLQGLNQRAQSHFRRAAQLAKAVGDDAAKQDAEDGEKLARRLADAACATARLRPRQDGVCDLPSQP